ncbi:hypothetical protein B0H13DRAFT_1887481 [Mycena leptocephala]|nr:hypothetical protein B0H13DRAFT_1887481 [Mycena leptocephala]
MVRLTQLVADCLAAAKPSVHLWRHVYLWAAADAFMMAILDNLADVPGPMIKSLLFAAPLFGSNLRLCDGLFVSPPTLFRGILPVMDHIRLYRTSLPWGSSQYFGSLTCLEMRDISRLAWPSIPNFVDTLTAAVHLRELVLGGGGIAVEPTFRLHTFILPALAVLTTIYNPDTLPMINVLKACSFPLLTEFNVVSFDQSAWLSALSLNIYQHLSHYSVSGSIAPEWHIPLLLRRLPELIVMDVDTSDSYVVELLHNPVSYCPSMRRLIVGEVKPEVLVDYVSQRNLHGNMLLWQLDFYHGLHFPLNSVDCDHLATLSSLVPILATFPVATMTRFSLNGLFAERTIRGGFTAAILMHKIFGAAGVTMFHATYPRFVQVGSRATELKKE